MAAAVEGNADTPAAGAGTLGHAAKAEKRTRQRQGKGGANPESSFVPADRACGPHRVLFPTGSGPERAQDRTRSCVYKLVIFASLSVRFLGSSDRSRGTPDCAEP
jgi:hypothetical protein